MFTSSSLKCRRLMTDVSFSIFLLLHSFLFTFLHPTTSSSCFLVLNSLFFSELSSLLSHLERKEVKQLQPNFFPDKSQRYVFYEPGSGSSLTFSFDDSASWTVLSPNGLQVLFSQCGVFWAHKVTAVMKISEEILTFVGFFMMAMVFLFCFISFFFLLAKVNRIQNKYTWAKNNEFILIKSRDKGK